LFQIELSKNYGLTEWRDDLKKVMLKAGVDNNPVVFLFSDTQVNLSNTARCFLATTTTTSTTPLLFSSFSPF